MFDVFNERAQLGQDLTSPWVIEKWLRPSRTCSAEATAIQFLLIVAQLLTKGQLSRLHYPRMSPPILCDPGIGSVQTFSGRHINVGLDGTIEMSAEDAQYYIRDGWTKLAEWTTDEAP